MTTPHFDDRDLRRAFGRFATGVTVITTILADGQKIGFTANSFASVSLDPPLVSWNYRSSPKLAVLQQAKYFLINVLSAEQIDISQQMSRPADDKFAGILIDQGLGGVPRIQGSLATFECELWQTVEAGDHVIFLAKVVRYSHADGEPLIFMDGGYALAHRAPVNAGRPQQQRAKG
jgi:flavin reductase (DIM6/NTAB) family NADH-FMN oxidoreductase RutF